MQDNSFLKKYKDIRVSVKISSNDEIRRLNKEYLKRDYTTDVLSFYMGEVIEDGRAFYLGDIIVNVDQAEKQSSEYGNTLEHEIADLVEHGVLHLLGVHHDDDDEHSVHGVETK